MKKVNTNLVIGNASFSEIYEIVYPMVNNYVKFRISKEDSDDLTQNAFVKLFENIDKYLDRTKTFKQLSGYLITFAKNNHIDNLRLLSHRNKISADALIDSENSVFDYPDNSMSIIDALDNKQTRHYMHLAIKKLRTDDKRVFVLYKNGYKYEEISQLLGMNINTVKTRIRRSKNELSEMLQDFREVA